MKHVTADIVIIGGGIAGLWTLHHLRQLGYHAMLVTAEAVGAGQTICSQGIIHSGLKYALTGRLNKSATAIARMPAYWRSCLQGQGTIDLTAVNVHSHCQYLWTQSSVRARFMALMASQAVKSLCERVGDDDYPSVFKHPAFKGDLYRLHEPVLDVPSLLQVLLQPYVDTVMTAKLKADNVRLNQHGVWQQLSFTTLQGDAYIINAPVFVLAAGNGNAEFLGQVTTAPVMQQRPLHMVAVRHHTDLACYAHHVDGHVNPRVTITSHGIGSDCVWYLGGEIAETGVVRSTQEQVAYAKQLMQTLFSWIDWRAATWHAFRVNRAEIANQGKRPVGPYVQALQNVILTWPTKLAFAPLVAQQVQTYLEKFNITASGMTAKKAITTTALPLTQQATVATLPWIER